MLGKPGHPAAGRTAIETGTYEQRPLAPRRAGLQRDRLVLAQGNHECRLPRFAWSLSRFARRVGSKAPYRDLTVGRAHPILLAGDEKPQRWNGCRISDGQLE